MTPATASEQNLTQIKELRQQVLSLQKQGSENTVALARVEQSVNFIHERLVGNGEVGLIRRVEEHDSFIKKAKGALVVIPVIGGLLGWALEHGLNMLSVKR